MKRFNRTAHMTLWLAVADRIRVTGKLTNIVYLKRKVFMDLGLPGKPNSDCYACEYTRDDRGSCYCGECPLADRACRDNDGVYHRIVQASQWGDVINKTDIRNAYEEAIELAMMPVKTGIVCE